MSERMSNPRRDNFEANKAAKEQEIAAAEQEAFENALYSDAGTEDFSDEARRRVDEAAKYEAHLQNMAERDGEGALLDAAKRRDTSHLENLESNEASPAFVRERDDAFAEYEAFKAKQQADAEYEASIKQAADEAFDAKLNAKGNGNLRQMDAVSQEIKYLRDKATAPETADRDTERLQELEDRLQDLLIEYSKADNYDPSIADVMMDRTDMDALDKAAANALAEEMDATNTSTSEVSEGGSEVSSEEDDVAKALKEAAENPAGADANPDDFKLPEGKDEAQSEASEADKDALLKQAAENPAGANVDPDKFKLPSDGEKDDVRVAGAPGGSEEEGVKKLSDKEQEELNDKVNGKKKTDEDREETEGSWLKRLRRKFSRPERDDSEKEGKPGKLTKLKAAVGGIALLSVATGAVGATYLAMHDDDPNKAKKGPAATGPSTAGERNDITKAKQDQDKGEAAAEANLEKWAAQEGEYPWDVVHRVMPDKNAMEELQIAVLHAREDGKDVRLVTLDNGKRSVKVGDSDKPADAMKALAPYLSQSK